MFKMSSKLNRIFSKLPNFGLKSVKYIQDFATQYTVDITKNSNNDHINEVYMNIKNTDTKKPTQIIVNVEVHKYKKQ